MRKLLQVARRAIATRRRRMGMVLVSVVVTVGIGSHGAVDVPAGGAPVVSTPSLRVEIAPGAAVRCRIELGPVLPLPDSR